MSPSFALWPVCGGPLIGANHGNLQSPGYPGDYPVNRDCVWTITVDAGRYITLAFGDLHLESHPSCDYDYLKVSRILFVMRAMFCKPS